LLWFGSRKSGKFVRCYAKEQLSAFRVEIEFHSSLLRSRSIFQADDLVQLVDIVYPKHVQFVDFDWEQLQLHLTRKMGTRGHDVLVAAKKRATSVQRLARYLRRKGILNVHRLYLPLAINKTIEFALRRWSRSFNEGEVKCAGRISCRGKAS
jgi:hypothetical protein